jgi:hypothetical protein
VNSEVFWRQDAVGEMMKSFAWIAAVIACLTIAAPSMAAWPNLAEAPRGNVITANLSASFGAGWTKTPGAGDRTRGPGQLSSTAAGCYPDASGTCTINPDLTDGGMGTGSSGQKTCPESVSYDSCLKRCSCQYDNNIQRCGNTATCRDFASAEKQACVGGCVTDWN